MSRELALIIPDSYRDAPLAARLARCNGCGTKGLGGWLVPDTLWGLDISEACNIHDWMYAEGNDKAHADLIFLYNMLVLVAQRGGWLAPLRRHRAVKYYLAVADLGGLAFDAAQS